AALREAESGVAANIAAARVRPHVADFGAPRFRLRAAAPRLVLYIGSSIGNLDPAAGLALLQRLRTQLAPGDRFLLGADLVKSPALLFPAYADAAGVTAEFNKNMLA